MSRVIRFRKILTFGALVALASLASSRPAPAQSGDLTYRNGTTTLNVQTTGGFQSLTISSDNFEAQGLEMTMHCPVRQVASPTEYSYACTMTLKYAHSARFGLAGAAGSGTAHVVLYLQPNYLGSDLDIHTDQLVMILPNKRTFTQFATTAAYTKAASAQVKVKILTTQACTDNAGEGFRAQEGVAVSIGGKVYTSNASGVIEADLPAGTHSITAAWKDYPLGYVAQNGLRQRPSEGGQYTVRVSENGERLELRMLTCDPDGQPKARAVITSIGVNGAGGPATIRVIRSKAHGNGFVGMKLRDGDEVLVSGTATLTWLQGNRTISFENPKWSSTILIGPDDTPAGNKAPESKSVLQILQGAVEFILPPREPDEPPFGASTHTVVMAEKGTQFGVTYDPATQTSTVVVQRGSVLVMPRNTALRSVTLSAGQHVAVTLNRVSSVSGASGAVARQNTPTRSAHGCVGFDGTWQGPGGTMQLRNGSGPYGATTLQGTVSGNVLRGTWRHPTVGQGTFAFTLAPDGDSFTTVWTSSSGVSGSYNTVRCTGP
jgi:hypothetical protein